MIEKQRWNGQGHIIYNGMIAMQNENALPIIKKNLQDENFDTIIEIGTAFGGFGLFLFENKGDQCKFITYDILDRVSSYKQYEQIDFRKKDVFHNTQKIADLIINGGKVALFCDGGNKIKEVNTFAKYLKNGDNIFAHDYCVNRGVFMERVFNINWNWCEITYNDIETACLQNNIITVDADLSFESLWFRGVKSG